MNRAWPVLLATVSLRRTRSVPIRVKVEGSFRVGDCGGGTAAASASSSPKVALCPAAWLTTESATRISPAGTLHRVAAAWTNMARAEAPASRSWSQELAIAVEPPVPWAPMPILA